jgi:hypothetical protein
VKLDVILTFMQNFMQMKCTELEKNLNYLLKEL